jgi:hypothetical protein
MGATAAILTVGSLVIGSREAKKREKRQNAAMERERAVHSAEQAYKARQARRQQIREARIKQAEVEAQAEAQGTTGSSAAVAAKDSLTQQLGSNIGDINTAVAFAEKKSSAALDVHKAGQKNDLERIAGVTSSVSSQFIGR